MTEPGPAMDTMSSRSAVDRMLYARSIAVIGASERMGYGGRLLSNLRVGGYKGAIYPVNPKYEKIQNLPAFPTVSSIPGVVDLAVIVVPADRIAGAVEDCGRKGVRVAIVITAGFAEQDREGARRQQEFVDIARGYGMRLSGPNCLGIANLPDGMLAAATAAPVWSIPGHRLQSGALSVVSQSGALAFSPILARSQARGIGLRHIISVGNQCDLTIVDFVDYLVESDGGTKVITVFMEGLPAGEGRRFLDVARRAAEVGKPIVMLKSARSARSADVARTHTAALAGNPTVYGGAFAQGAVIEVTDLDDLWEVGNLAALQPGLGPDAGVGFIASSGGMSSLFTDACSEEGLPLPSLSEHTRARIAEILDGRGFAGNPTDASGLLNQPGLEGILGLMEQDPAIDLVAIGLTQRAAGERSRVTADHLVSAFGRAKVPYVVVWASTTALGEEAGDSAAGVRIVGEAGIPVFEQPTRAARALGLMKRYTTRRAGILADSDDHQAEPPAPPAEVPDGFLSALAAVADAGIPVAEAHPADDPESACAAAELVGYPVVLKIDAPGLQHKTEVGGVRLQLNCASDVEHAFEELWSSTTSLGPQRRIVLQKQYAGGLELILGGLVDPVFGPVVTLGGGGTLVELLGDIEARVAPLSALGATQLVESMRLAPLLRGWRGGPALDAAALAGAVCRFSHFVAAAADVVSQVELNPLMVLPDGQGVVAVDAVFVGASRTGSARC